MDVQRYSQSRSIRMNASPRDPTVAAQVYLVSDLRVDVGQQRVTREQVEIPLPKLSFDLLVALIRAAPNLVSTDDLMALVWPGRVVNLDTVNQRVKLLRDALGDEAHNPRYVAGLRGRGYRLIAPVVSATLEQRDRTAPSGRGLASSRLLSAHGTTPETEPQAPPAAPLRRSTLRYLPPQRWIFLGMAGLGLLALLAASSHRRAIDPWTTAATPAAEPSIAVLPFVHISPDKSQEYFADGLTEELSAQLAQLHGMRVIGRASAFAFKGKNEDLRLIGTTLGVDHLLEGSVRRSGNELRITAELVDARSGTRLWSNIYDRTLDDVFSIQKDIAQAVATELSSTLYSGGGDELSLPGTDNAAAYDAYLSAQADLKHIVSNRYMRGIQELERAVSLDPKFVRAWSALVRAYDGIVGTQPASDADYRKKAQEALSRALELVPDSRVLQTQATMRSMDAARDWVVTERIHRKYIEGSGSSDYMANYVFGFGLRNVGRVRESLEYFKRAQRLEPLLLNASVQLQDTYLILGDSKAAEAEYERSKQIAGDRGFADSEGLQVPGLDRHDHALIERFFQAHPPNSPDSPSPVIEGLDNPAGALAILRLRYRDPAVEASSMNTALLAEFAAYYGDSELALQFLQKAFRTSDNVFFVWHPVYKDVRRLPGFKDLMRDLRLVDYWRVTGNWGEFCHPVGQNDFECY
jgi:TolB-like protein/DNA-binding winged helix-turn-helix (wHTH) protein